MSIFTTSAVMMARAFLAPTVSIFTAFTVVAGAFLAPTMSVATTFAVFVAAHLCKRKTCAIWILVMFANLDVSFQVCLFRTKVLVRSIVNHQDFLESVKYFNDDGRIQSSLNHFLVPAKDRLRIIEKFV